MKTFSGNCPICGGKMDVVKFHCPGCMVEVKGRFNAGGFEGLSAEQIEFVKVFLRCRGNIKDVERELGISYPTVRNRLEAVTRTLGLTPGPDESLQEKKDALDRLERGEIDTQTAVRLLSGKGGQKQ